MSMKIYFPGGKKVYADFNGFTHKTDQRANIGGDGSAPAPYEMFLASLGTCAGIYVLGFCESRGLPTDGIELEQDMKFNPATQKMEQITIKIKTPDDFPKQYLPALEKTASLCAVKKTIEDRPEFIVTAETVEAEAV